jgi:hypothetical protein
MSKLITLQFEQEKENSTRYKEVEREDYPPLLGSIYRSDLPRMLKV